MLNTCFYLKPYNSVAMKIDIQDFDLKGFTSNLSEKTSLKEAIEANNKIDIQDVEFVMNGFFN
jgi:hypothetical protein